MTRGAGGAPCRPPEQGPLPRLSGPKTVSRGLRPRLRIGTTPDGCRCRAAGHDGNPGHSQISVTMAVYTHVVHDTRREAISRMDRLLRRGPPTARVVTAAKGPGPRSARGLLAGAPAGFEPATPASGARGAITCLTCGIQPWTAWAAHPPANRDRTTQPGVAVTTGTRVTRAGAVVLCDPRQSP